MTLIQPQEKTTFRYWVFDCIKTELLPCIIGYFYIQYSAL